MNRGIKRKELKVYDVPHTIKKQLNILADQLGVPIVNLISIELFFMTQEAQKSMFVNLVSTFGTGRSSNEDNLPLRFQLSEALHDKVKNIRGIQKGTLSDVGKVAIKRVLKKYKAAITQ